MARSAGKRAAKTPATPTTSSKPIATSPGPPAPFQYAPASLRSFFSTLPTDHIYLVHLDATSPALKKRVFAVPVLLNILITLGLCVRIYFAAPVYLQQIITIFGYDTPYSVDTRSVSSGELMNTLFSRMGLLMIDWVIFGFIGSWPKEFVFGGGSSRFTGPREWRSTLGFQDTEVIVRRGRKWDTPLLIAGNADQAKTWKVEEELTIQVKVERAMRTTYIAKTGLLLLDKDWDLDFKAMLDAHKLVDRGTIPLKELDNLVLVYYQKQWLVWRFHEKPRVSRQEEGQDTVVERFRSMLRELDSENAFFRWIEIVQFETSQPGGFTEGRRTEAVRELKSMLTKKGVDFERFWEGIGGQAGLPGFEVQDHP